MDGSLVDMAIGQVAKHCHDSPDYEKNSKHGLWILVYFAKVAPVMSNNNAHMC